MVFGDKVITCSSSSFSSNDKKVRGEYILEVPKQYNPIPSKILDKANELKIIIRDSERNVNINLFYLVYMSYHHHPTHMEN